ncbi:MAG: transcription termination/antitermination protein NusG [Candidatus Bipolaricaulaceae bacterium]
MQRKRWYAIQTHTGSELRLKEELEERVHQLGWEKYFEPVKVGDQVELFFVPVEEAVTSRSVHGRTTDYRIPYDYDLLVSNNTRVQRGELLARKPPRHAPEPAQVVAVEPYWRVVVETPNHTEKVYLIPQTKVLRRDVRVGSRVRPGLPSTLDADGRYTFNEPGEIVARERVKKIVLRYESQKEEEFIVPEALLPPQVKEGAKLPAGAEIEREHKIYAGASGLAKIREYKEKRVVTIQRIEKRRLIPGYVFAKMGLDEEQMRELVRGLERAARFLGSRSTPVPIDDPEATVLSRLSGVTAAPVMGSKPKVEVGFEVGEVVQIVEGPFADFTGEIKEIDKEAEEAVVMVRIFGRETPVRVSLSGIEKI